MEIRTLGVVGAGTMGAGIAQLCLQSGFEVRLYDLNETILSNADGRILKGLQRVEKPSAFSLLRKTTRLDALRDCDFVIEAASEDLRIKRDLFTKLDVLLEPPRVIATNTSSLSVREIALAAENPDRVAGMHFFNPAPILKLVEVVRADRTSEATLETVLSLAKRLGKTAVQCKDTPGFIANRVTRPFYLVGMRLLEAGRGGPDAIDKALREEGGFKMGPFELIDLIGLDVNRAISEVVYQNLGKPQSLKPCPVQDRLIERGCLGRKNGRGFYLYGDVPPGTVNPVVREIAPSTGTNHLDPKDVLRRVVGAVLEEAKKAAGEGVAAPQDIDTAMRLGMNWPKGPFEWEGSL